MFSPAFTTSAFQVRWPKNGLIASASVATVRHARSHVVQSRRHERNWGICAPLRCPCDVTASLVLAGSWTSAHLLLSSCKLGNRFLCHPGWLAPYKQARHSGLSKHQHRQRCTIGLGRRKDIISRRSSGGSRRGTYRAALALFFALCCHALALACSRIGHLSGRGRAGHPRYSRRGWPEHFCRRISWELSWTIRSAPTRRVA